MKATHLARGDNSTHILDMKSVLITTSALCAFICSQSSIAFAEMIAEHDGGTVSVYFAPVEQDSKTVRGVVSFDNEPGWKSYWQDPGTSGIPPQINFMVEARPVKSVLHYPMPQWMTDDYGGFIGYVGQTDVPFEVYLDAPLAADTPINVNLFAGVCRDVCIPVTGHFSTVVPQSSTTMTSIEQLRVNRSFERLPATQHPAISHVSARHGKDGAIIVAIDGEKPHTSFAVGKVDGLVVASFGPPEVVEATNGKTIIQFQRRGNHDAHTPFDLNFVANVEPNGFEVTLSAENIR